MPARPALVSSWWASLESDSVERVLGPKSDSATERRRGCLVKKCLVVVPLFSSFRLSPFSIRVLSIEGRGSNPQQPTVQTQPLRLGSNEVSKTK